MHFSSTLLAVADIDLSVRFYTNALGLSVVSDFGSNVTLTGGVCLQTVESWKKLTGISDVVPGGCDCELYFETEDFDGFIARLDIISSIRFVHRPKEHEWGQRVVRFFDPDMHIIEVGENIAFVCRRFISDGMTAEQVAKRMDVPLSFVISCLK